LKGRRLHHIGLEVVDLNRSLAFYRDLLGLRVTDEGEGGGPDTDELVGAEGMRFRYAELDLGADQLLELIQPLAPATDRAPAAGRSPSVAHVGLVVNDIDEAYGRLKAAGLPTRSAPVELQEGGAWQGVRALYAADPDGFTVELLQLP
jgi:lactoylglutathione lyase